MGNLADRPNISVNGIRPYGQLDPFCLMPKPVPLPYCGSLLPTSPYTHFPGLHILRCQWRVRSIFTGKEILAPEPEEDHTLKVLSRPIGLQSPPQPGENSGIDHRTWRERRDDFFNHEKHLAKRAKMTKQAARPYFRDWTRANYHKGKTFLSPSRIFRADKALYFPNFVGNTLATPSQLSDTTPTLQGKVSVVSLVSSQWAENQKITFTADEKHPGLAELLRKEAGILQKVEVNIEEDWMKALLVTMFMGSIRRQRKESEWGNYFLVKRGVTDEIREGIQLANRKVAYLYLVDWNCRIRWAGSGHAYEGERESLVAGCRRLIEGWKAEREGGLLDQRSATLEPKDASA
ncbi:MAG: hypothetical protein LQ342_001732 [Letrouitia transgressa]|nr:MAG: hypothetical protein LQ342_001732 [Letrouitia transgressa]